MSTSNSHDTEETRSGRRSVESEREPQHAPRAGASLIDMLPYSPSLLDADGLHERGSSSTRAATMHGMQQTHGNRAVQRLVGPSPGPRLTSVPQRETFGLKAIQRSGPISPWDQDYVTPTAEEIAEAERRAAQYGLPEKAPPSSQPTPRPPAPAPKPPTTYPYDDMFPERLPGEAERLAQEEAAAAAAKAARQGKPPAGGTLPQTPSGGGGLGGALLRYGGGALGVLGGGLGLYGGGSEVWDAGGDGGDISDIGSILHGGLTMGAGGASMIGGIGTLLGGTAASTGALGGAMMLGKAGLVLGAGLLGYAGGRALDEGSDWLGERLSETSVGESLGMYRGGSYGISSLIGKSLYNTDKAIGTLWGDESKAYNPETDEPTKVDRSYENTLAYKINEWLD